MSLNPYQSPLGIEPPQNPLRFFRLLLMETLILLLAVMFIFVFAPVAVPASIYYYRYVEDDCPPFTILGMASMLILWLIVAQILYEHYNLIF